MYGILDRLVLEMGFDGPGVVGAWPGKENDISMGCIY